MYTCSKTIPLHGKKYNLILKANQEHYTGWIIVSITTTRWDEMKFKRLMDKTKDYSQWKRVSYMNCSTTARDQTTTDNHGPDMQHHSDSAHSALGSNLVTHVFKWASYLRGTISFKAGNKHSFQSVFLLFCQPLERWNKLCSLSFIATGNNTSPPMPSKNVALLVQEQIFYRGIYIGIEIRAEMNKSGIQSE